LAGFDQLLASFTTEIQLQEPMQICTFQVEPVPHTAGREVAVTFEVLADVGLPLRLATHKPSPDTESGDLYIKGSALLNRRPLPGDLYFLSY
jgi:hypothetical protein